MWLIYEKLRGLITAIYFWLSDVADRWSALIADRCGNPYIARQISSGYWCKIIWVVSEKVSWNLHLNFSSWGAFNDRIGSAGPRSKMCPPNLSITRRQNPGWGNAKEKNVLWIFTTCTESGCKITEWELWH